MYTLHKETMSNEENQGKKNYSHNISLFRMLELCEPLNSPVDDYMIREVLTTFILRGMYIDIFFLAENVY